MNVCMYASIHMHTHTYAHMYTYKYVISHVLSFVGSTTGKKGITIHKLGLVAALLLAVISGLKL